MQGRKRLLALGLFAVLAACGARVFLLQAEARKALLREPPQAVGLGDSLQHLVLGLERELAARAEYVLPKGKDPFDLRRVVRIAHPTLVKEKEEAGGMRLSMTLLSSEKSLAIVKHQGLSHTLAIGDSLDGWHLLAIEQKTITLEKQGKTLVLVNQPASQAEIQLEGRDRGSRRTLEELKL